jgi:hypothetical protein
LHELDRFTKKDPRKTTKTQWTLNTLTLTTTADKHAVGNSTGDPDYLQTRGDDFATSYFKIFAGNNKGI